jgi:hypothetical protein
MKHFCIRRPNVCTTAGRVSSQALSNAVKIFSCEYSIAYSALRKFYPTETPVRSKGMGLNLKSIVAETIHIPTVQTIIIAYSIIKSPTERFQHCPFPS